VPCRRQQAPWREETSGDPEVQCSRRL